MKNIFLTGAVMVLLLFSCKKDLGIPANGLQADHKNTVLATPDPTFTTVSTYLGDGRRETLDGPLNIARTSQPSTITIGPDGSFYFSAFRGSRIRKISPDGIVSTVAGSGIFGYCDGPALKAQFSSMGALVVTNDGIIYMCDGVYNKIRKIENGMVTTFAGSTAGSPDGTRGDVDGIGQQARFFTPTGMALAPDGSLYVADANNHKIKKITPAGVVTTIAGSTDGSADGPALLAKFIHPYAIVVLEDGTIVVVDSSDHKIRKISPAGVVSTFAGGAEGYADGLGTSAKFSSPSGIALAPNGTLYISDNGNQRIRKVSPSGLVTTIAGNALSGFQDGPVLQARFSYPEGLLYLNDAIYICDVYNNRIRKIE
jgi:ATP-dependent protease HslVU (ClpYQ) peptidase subunit